MEYHAGHQASHVTPLWSTGARGKQLRRSGNKMRAYRSFVRENMQVMIGPTSEQKVTATTTLEDMQSEYTGYIGVGTGSDGKAAFRARVVFDTGSTNLWVASVLCTDGPCKEKQHQYYDPEQSLTQESFSVDEGVFDSLIESDGDSTVSYHETQNGPELDIKFGTGELKGPLHKDTFHVGPMRVRQQPFGMIREMNGEVFASFPFEGILGLGFRSMSWHGLTPFFEDVIDQGLLKHNEFAFYFNTETDQPSALLWGGIDSSLYRGPIRMFPVTQAHYWAIDLVDFRHGNQSLLQGSSEDPVPKHVIVDSGTTYFTAPSWLNTELLSHHIPDARCDEVERSYAPLVYVLRSAAGEEVELEVSQETYMVEEGSGNCRAAFMATDIKNKWGPALILGEVFMRHFFTVFDRGNGEDANARIGFAAAEIGARPKVNESHPDLGPFLQLEDSSELNEARTPTFLVRSEKRPNA